jgi:elongation factor G
MSSDDRAKFEYALRDLAQQDPTLRISSLPTDGHTVISGMGELHLEVICDRVLREYKIKLHVGKPKVIYLETIHEQAEAEGKYVRHTEGRSDYAHVKIRLEPGEPGSGYQFVDEIREGAVPREFVQSVNLAVQDALKAGILSSHELVDLRVVLYDGSYHAEDSNEMAFKMAASMALNQALRTASPVVLEPVMAIEVTTPEEFAGSIMGDLNSRRGLIEGMEHPAAGSVVIKALVPLAEMLGYATDIRSSTLGRASYSMHFAAYEVAPHAGESGAEETGVTANKPTRPKTGTGFAAASLDAESE